MKASFFIIYVLFVFLHRQVPLLKWGILFDKFMFCLCHYRRLSNGTIFMFYLCFYVITCRTSCRKRIGVCLCSICASA